MKACGNWVVITLKKEERASGLLIENLNIGVIHSKGEHCAGDYQKDDEVYFNKRNAVEILEYFIVRNEDIYMVIE
tara:strand:- start:347 stop:571 length:225 start_codon:yes stop_codon:yes gene_type:complete